VTNFGNLKVKYEYNHKRFGKENSEKAKENWFN
jgi:hypothetical protein